MADYYTHTSFLVQLNSHAEEEWWKAAVKNVTDAMAAVFEEEAPENTEFADLVRGFGDEYDWGFDCEIGEKAVWFKDSDGCPNLDGAANLIQAYMKKFDRKDAIHFQWANTCSKPRVDSYGGGAYIVTANEARAYSSGMLVRKALDRLKEQGTIALVDE